jgi:hypothetical protein
VNKVLIDTGAGCPVNPLSESWIELTPYIKLLWF